MRSDRGDPRAVPGVAASGVAALDGAAGTLVPSAVVDAVADGLRFSMANLGGAFAGSERSDETVAGARRAIADLVGGEENGVVFGPNMTTLTFRIADTLAAGWGPGDEIVVTSLDHDANIRPWVLAAASAGARVRFAQFDVDTGELPAEAFEELIGERTRLVAVTAASNAIGTRPDVRAITERAHAAGALTYVDGVHATPHVPTDVGALGADFYACSSYKFFGPHAGCVIAEPALLEKLPPAKLAPSSNLVPWRFERGTPSFELLAGITAAVDWIAGLTGRPGAAASGCSRRSAANEEHLSQLLARMTRTRADRRRHGARIPRRRTSTVSFVIDGLTPGADRAGTGPSRHLGLGRRQLRIRADAALRPRRQRRCGAGQHRRLQRRGRHRPAGGRGRRDRRRLTTRSVPSGEQLLGRFGAPDERLQIWPCAIR